MGILWFGKQTKLGDFKPKDLEKERLKLQVIYDQLLTRQRRVNEELKTLYTMAKDPSLTDAELAISAYKADRLNKRRSDSEAEMQLIIGRLDMLDSTLELIRRRKELEQQGIWGKLNTLDPDELQQQLEDIAVERKKGEMNIERIAEVLTVDEIDVKANRTPGFQREYEAMKAIRDGK